MHRFLISFFVFALLAAAEPADTIVSARYVVTMDAQRRVIENGAVAIRGERIVEVGTRADIDRKYHAKNRIDEPTSLVAPGLINTHTHAPMSLFRGIADDLRLQDWLTKFIFPAEAKNVNPEFVRWGTRLACLEMLLSGTTTYVDMYYFEEVIAEETKAAGMRGVLGQSVIGFPVSDAKTPSDGLKRAELFIRRYQNDSLIVPAVAPHAVYTNSDETLKAARELANRYKVPFVIHLSETKKENDDSMAERHMTPTQLLESLGAFNGRTIAAHGVWVSDADIAILQRRGVGVAHCPSSNMKLASGVAPVMKYLRAGVAVGLGTDGVAGSNNDVNMFEEMDLAAKLQKVTSGDPEALNARQAMEMATIQGARAIGMQKEIGSLEAGKRADLITVSLSEAHAVPMYNVYSQLVYALKGSDVRHVVINGEIVVRDRKSVHIDSAAVLRKAAEYQRSVQSSLRP
ncbi:MAG: amidohydrolase family protein [Bryobacteraceae bacterium]